MKHDNENTSSIITTLSIIQTCISLHVCTNESQFMFVWSNGDPVELAFGIIGDNSILIYWAFPSWWNVCNRKIHRTLVLIPNCSQSIGQAERAFSYCLDMLADGLCSVAEKGCLRSGTGATPKCQVSINQYLLIKGLLWTNGFICFISFYSLWTFGDITSILLSGKL